MRYEKAVTKIEKVKPKLLNKLRHRDNDVLTLLENFNERIKKNDLKRQKKKEKLAQAKKHSEIMKGKFVSIKQALQD